LTIEVEDAVAEDLTTAAAELGIAPEQLAGQVVTERFPARRNIGRVDLSQSSGVQRRDEEDVFGDLETKTAAAIALAVEDRRRRGLPMAVDKGNGVEFLP
jgi:hypothetical protein